MTSSGTHLHGPKVKRKQEDGGDVHDRYVHAEQGAKKIQEESRAFE